MLGRLYPAQDCSAARALERVGERWTLLILRDAIFRGFTRFSQFQQSLAIAPNVLTKRLNDLVDAGILSTTDDAARSGAREYVLTDAGRDFTPVIIALTRWGDRWVNPGPAEFVHDECGTELVPELTCPHCDRAVDPEHVDGRRRVGR